jgi:hypothetical protein
VAVVAVGVSSATATKGAAVVIKCYQDMPTECRRYITG